MIMLSLKLSVYSLKAGRQRKGYFNDITGLKDPKDLYLETRHKTAQGLVDLRVENILMATLTLASLKQRSAWN